MRRAVVCMRLIGRMPMRPILLFVLVVLAACGDEHVMPAVTDPTAGVDASCDPIAPDHCGFPFPNDFWRVDGHVAFGPSTLPLARGQRIDPKAWADADGWSAGQAPMTFMPNATATGLPPQDDMSRSIRADSPTILLNADTGELVPHFSEIDMSTFHDYDRALLLRPAVRLRDKTRYIVAIRHVVDADGKTLAPSASFKALRDSVTTTSAALEARRSHFEDIFAKLKAAGIARDDLQLAWDYTTATRDNQTRVMLAMRDDALAKVGPMGPEYTITNVENAPNPWLAKRLTGLMTVPLYLDKPD